MSLQLVGTLSDGLDDQVSRGWPPLLSGFGWSFLSHYRVREGRGILIFSQVWRVLIGKNIINLRPSFLNMCSFNEKQ